MLTGQYRDIRQFIYDLETSPEFLVLENVGLSSQGTDDGGALSDGRAGRDLLPGGRQ